MLDSVGYVRACVEDRERERAQIGHGWSVRSSFQTTPLPSTSFRLLSLFPAPRPPVSRLSPPDRHPASPRPCPVGSAAAVSIYPALAAAQPPLHTRPIYRLARLRSTPLALRFRTIRDARLNPHRFARYRIIRAHLRPLLRTDLQQQVNNLFPPFFVPSDRTPR